MVTTRAAKLTSRIPLIIADLDDKMFEGVVEVAERIAEGARQRVPDASPYGVGLIGSIHVETGADLVKSTELMQTGLSAGELSAGAVAVVAGDNEHFYGHIVENGGVNQPAQPFLVPAFEAERQNLNDIVGGKLRDL